MTALLIGKLFEPANRSDHECHFTSASCLFVLPCERLQKRDASRRILFCGDVPFIARKTGVTVPFNRRRDHRSV